jgi:hypothetical protein
VHPTKESSVPNVVKRSPPANLFTAAINVAGSLKIPRIRLNSALNAAIVSIAAISYKKENPWSYDQGFFMFFWR